MWNGVFFHLSGWLIILQWWRSCPRQSNLIKKTSEGRFWVHPFLQSRNKKGEYHGWHHIKTMQMWTSEAASELQNCPEDTWWELFDRSDVEHNTFAVLSYITFCAVIVTVNENIKVSPNQRPWVINIVRKLLKANNVALLFYCMTCFVSLYVFGFLNSPWQWWPIVSKGFGLYWTLYPAWPINYTFVPISSRLSAYSDHADTTYQKVQIPLLWESPDQFPQQGVLHTHKHKYSAHKMVQNHIVSYNASLLMTSAPFSILLCFITYTHTAFGDWY